MIDSYLCCLQITFRIASQMLSAWASSPVDFGKSADFFKIWDRNSVVGIATRYEMGDQGIEFRCGRNFCTRPDRHCGPYSRSYNGYLGFSPGIKRQRRGVDHQPSSSAEVKERLELYLFSLSGSSWYVQG